MQQAQGALVFRAGRVVGAGEKLGSNPSLYAKQDSTFMPSAQHSRSNASVSAWKCGSSVSLGHRPAMWGRVIW
jgi:hypothetical protein